MPPPALETRDALAPFAGAWVRCRGLAARDERERHQRRTLVWGLLVHDPDAGEWVKAAEHVWVWGADLCRQFGDGTPVEFEAVVNAYQTTDRAGCRVQRYGLTRVRGAVPLGGPPDDPARAAAALLVRAYGWERVADALVALHGEGA